MNTEKFDFKDQRSRKVVIVSHCVLNQNSRISTCAMSANTIPGVIESLIAQGYGLIQGPCPETELFGLRRTGMDVDDLREPKPAEEGEIYDRLKSEENIGPLKDMAIGLVKTAKEYIDNGVEVDAILGIAGSPSCGVDVTYRFGLQSGSGAFIEELKTAMEEQGIRVPIVEINDALPEKNQAILERISLKEVT